MLDLGAGTGLFATAIASWFDVAVVAVEPSAGMRHQAQQARAVSRPPSGDQLAPVLPGAGRIADTFPAVEATVAAFEAAGFSFQALQQVPQVRAPSLRAALERVRLRADSTLQLLPDEEFAKGLAALERAAARRPRLRSSTTSTSSCFADHEEEHTAGPD